MTTSASRSRCARASPTPTGSASPRDVSRPPRSRGPETPADRDLAIALARELLHGTGAVRVSVALDAAHPAVVECARLSAIVVHEHDAVHELAHDAASDIELPPLPLMRRLAPFDVDAAAGTVAGVLGGLEMLGRAVRALASMLPGESVVAAEFETTDAATTLGLAGRPGEPVVVVLGEHEFELDC